MEKLKELKNLIREVINLVTRFFKHYGIADEMLKIPKNIKLMGLKVGMLNLGITVITTSFAFMLKATNMMIEARLILLGIILFMLYRGQQVVREAFRLFQISESKKCSLILEDEIILRGSKIISKVSNKVLKYDSAKNLHQVQSNETVLNTIKVYLDKYWYLKTSHLFNVLEIITVIIMLTAAILTNTAIPQIIFIPLIVTFVVISFFSSAYISMQRRGYYSREREYYNKQTVIINDLLRSPVIVRHDLDMRINKLKESVVASNENIMKLNKKENLSRLFTAILETFFQYGIIIFYLLGVEWNSINLATITEITATLVVLETALSQIQAIASTLNGYNANLIVLEKEEEDMKAILEVYHKEFEKSCNPKKIEEIRIAPFSIQYVEESRNDRPFTLISETEIHLEKGEVAVLYGPSGSGKSTFMKMLTERIQLRKSTEIPSTSRFLFYDEKLKFGSLTIFEEVFCCTENPNLEKMQEILKNLHLWDEIKLNCVDVWKWMQEKKFEHSLSNGQKQRLILAKMLYWMDDGIDVLVLDECTSGLDDKVESNSAEAERILEYVVRYANSDKKRIVVIATHQNIDGFKAKLAREFNFRNLQFEKKGECNLVKEI